MTSAINPSNINILYPIAGQDNDTQGFRDNFRNIKNNLNAASLEITALQDTIQLTPKIPYITGNVGNVSYPASPSSAGVQGQITWTNQHVYVCIATDTWVRANVSNSW
jgi:hypothetical protein